MKNKKMPTCPNCNNQMVIIWYLPPEEYMLKFIDDKTAFYAGLEDINVDRLSPNRIKYHCYNCNRSYSKNLKKYIIDKSDSKKKFEKTKKYISDLVEELANDVINDLDENEIEELKKKPKYSHFGIGLYIRNNFIYNNEKAKFRIDPDKLSSMIYDKMLEKVSKINNKKTKKYKYIEVSYNDDIVGNRYSYKTTIDDIEIGDTVLVDRNGCECEGTVESIDFYTKETAPYPPEKTKDIIEVIGYNYCVDSLDGGEKEFCPFCDNELIPIIYGLPSYEMFEKEQKGEIHLGGCVVESYSPNYYCKKCKKNIIIK